MKPTFLVILRLPFYLTLLVFSLLCLFAYVPFTYVNFIQTNLFSGMGFLKVYFELFFGLSFLAFLPTLEGPLRNIVNRTGQLMLISLAVLGGLVLVLFPNLGQLPNDSRSLLLGAAPLLWLIGLGILETASGWNRIPGIANARGHSPSLLGSCLLTGLTSFFVFNRSFPIASPDPFLNSITSLSFVRLLLVHLLVFGGLYVLLAVIDLLASLMNRPLAWSFAGNAMVFGVGLFIYLKFYVAPALLLYGAPSTGAAILGSVAVTIAWVGLVLRLRATEHSPAVGSGIDLFLSPLRLNTWSRNLPVGLLLMVFVWSGGRYAISLVAPLDWNHLFRDFLLLFLFLAGFSLFYGMLNRRLEGLAPPDWMIPLPLVLILLAYHGLLVMNPVLRAAPAGSEPLAHASGDLVSGWLHRPDTEDSQDFYRFLQAASNLPRQSTRITRSFPAVDVDSNRSPHVFLFILDSLRPDYLAPYNPRVDFTPAIRRFSRRAVTYTNAYSRYSATGLSIPSLWVGGMTPHLQYPSPFAPLNRLLHLLRGADYRLHLAWDSILEQILPSDLPYQSLGDPATEREPFCEHIDRLNRALTDRESNRPMFAYTLPQDLHIAVIRDQGESVVGQRSVSSYGSFYAPYASRLRRMDRCFGRFVDQLRDEKMLRKSLVILTSDHGEALGESGRWGHANTLAPVALKIPLIVHYPEGVSTGQTRPDQLSFLTDITPTLYDLVDIPTNTKPPFLGRSLLGARYHPGSDYLVASSYGAIYGMVNGKGNRLFVGDALNYRDSFYRTGPSPSGQSLGVTKSVRDKYREKIKQRIRDLHQFYGVPPTGP